MSKTLDHHVVARAREIISDEMHWTRFDYAQLDSSDEADPADPLAVRFCAVGALRRAAYELSSDIDSFATLTDRVQDGIEIVYVGTDFFRREVENRAHRVLIAMGFHECVHALARVREQHVVNERDRADRSFDVDQRRVGAKPH